MPKNKRKTKNYVLIKDGIVLQKQPYQQDGFIEAPEVVVPGFLYDGKNFNPPEPQAPSWEKIRSKRNSLLSQTDWTQLSDTPKSVKDKYAEYRQKLRDIPQDFDETEDVVFPEIPT